MKAIQYQDFGSSEVLSLNELAQPVIQQGKEILIQVKAASVNPLDIKIRMGYMQQMRPVQLPFTPGLNCAGIICAIGTEVQNFKVGDEVIAITMGNAYAEYVLANEAFVVPKPKNLSFVEATSLAVNLGTAQTLLFGEGQLKTGDRVLIQGAAGAVGATMVQLAKLHGLYVYATASGKGVELAKQLGADEVFDYKSADFNLDMQGIDLVADCAGGETQKGLFKVLKQGGKLLSIAGMPSQELAAELNIEARFVSSNLSAQSLLPALKFAETGELKPFVTKVFALQEAAKAQDFVSAGGSNGKVVLSTELLLG